MVAKRDPQNRLTDKQRTDIAHLTFFMGAVPRSMDKALKATKDGGLSAKQLGMLVTDQAAGVSSGPPLSDEALALFGELLRRLHDANKPLRELVLNGDGTCSVHRILLDDWASKLKPLSFRKVKEAWADVAARVGSPHAADSSYLKQLLDELSDHHLLVQRRAEVREWGEDTHSTWPVSAAQVVFALSGTSIAQKVAAAALLQPVQGLLEVGAAVATITGRTLKG